MPHPLARAKITLIATQGSTPRQVGATMIVLPDGTTLGTIGGGKFEHLAREAALQTLADGKPTVREFPLHENHSASFGAICGGTATLFIQPQTPPPHLTLVGAGHCAQAIARLAIDLDYHVTLLDDRTHLPRVPNAHYPQPADPPTFLSAQTWLPHDAVALVSRNHHIDREALATLLRSPQPPPYIGMIGSRKKIQHVFTQLEASGINPTALKTVHAPIGLDIGADTPAEIAVAVLAQILQQRQQQHAP